MTRVNEILRLIEKVVLNGKAADRPLAEVSVETSKLITELRELLLHGETTGDRLYDVVIINHHSAYRSWVEPLRGIEREVATHRNELIMVVERRVERHTHRQVRPSHSTDA